MRPLVLLWRFGRPHTLIGTTLSVLGVYVLVAVDVAEVGDRLGDLLATLVAAWSVNIFITGINQLTDVEIDRINKPFLPIAAGDLSPRAGRWIVAGSALLPIAMALTQGPIEIVAVLTGLGVGVAYSLPPLRLKRWPAVFLAGSHLLVLAALLVAARRTDPADRAVFTGFYMFVWKLFFLEYVIVPLAWLMA